MMETHVKQKLISFGVKAGDVVGVAVSGGVDSMALLTALCNLRAELNIIIVAYHMEHGIRGARSEADMRFVQCECDRRRIKCVTERADVPRLARERGLSLEMAAREARYAFLDAQEAAFIATAHHADDLAETVLMNLCRGAGLAGLCGIPERRGRYIRPLLDVTRAQIMEYARAQGITWVDDATNEDVSYTRNYVRAQLLPRLAAVNSRAVAHIAGTARLLAEEEAALDALARAVGGVSVDTEGARIDIDVLLAQPAALQKRMVRLALKQSFGLTDIGQKNVDDVLRIARRGISGKRVLLGKNLAAWVVYGQIRVGRSKKQSYNEPLSDFSGEGVYTLGPVTVTCRAYRGVPEFAAGTEYLDGDALSGACFRHRRPGDYIRPLGMSGKKRLSDYLSDRKVPLARRDSLVLLARGSEVFWVIGVGVSETSKVKSGSRCLAFDWTKNDDWGDE